ncbi:MAG: C25 family cysteine peptidase [Bdellovibrionota bacterium]
MKQLSLAAALAPLLFTLAAEAKTIRLGPQNSQPSVVREEVVVRDGAEKVVKVSFQLHKLRTKTSKGRYAALKVDKLPLTSEVGLPALPFQAVTVDAALSDIRVAADLGMGVSVNVGRVLPAQPEPCRCAVPVTPVFSDKVDNFAAAPSGFVLQSLGDFRGQPVSRVLLYPHKYDPKTGTLLLYPNAHFEISYRASPKALKTADSIYDYLVITPRDLMGGLNSWVDWKRSSQNIRFNVVAYEDIGSPNTDALKTWIHNEYGRAQFKYALIVGGKSRIPQQTVETSTDKATPSDLPYFTMGGADDVIPDVLAGRVVADNADVLQRILKKWMDYERSGGGEAGWHRDIGIASNQGSGPSDAEYIGAIQDKLKTVLGTDPVYLFQGNPDSTADNFNAQMAQGAMWVTYIGHGSGIEWPSFGTSYTIPNVQAMRNAGAVKPVWIDVACLNGTLEPAAAGASLTASADPSGAPIGVTAYLGGTVLVSWHPPAIFARGVAFKMSEMVQPILGEAIQAGQRYLTENSSNLLDIASNQRWYHLQGDPSMRLRLK